MVRLGIEIIPEMTVSEVVDLILAAEELGYDTCLVCDEGFMPDVYVCLGAAARQTTRVRLGAITNPYTRHPMVTAVAAATLNGLSHGRALVTLVPGGTKILGGMGLARQAPVAAVRDTVDVLRQLWTGERVTWQGECFRLDTPPITMGMQDIPIWIAARGPKMLELAGAEADGLFLMNRSDIGPALEVAAKAYPQGRRAPKRIYADRIAYTPEMLDKSGTIFIYAIMDAPARMLRSMGLSDETVQNVRQAFAAGGLAAAARLVTPDMIKAFQIAGTASECQQIIRDLIDRYRLDEFLLVIGTPGLKANLERMKDVKSFVA